MKTFLSSFQLSLLSVILNVLSCNSLTPSSTTSTSTSTSSNPMNDNWFPQKEKMKLNVISTEDPVILSIQNIIPKEIANEMKNTILNTECQVTTNYQEDIFASGAKEKEDEHFSKVIEPFLTPSSPNQIPTQYQSSKLESFVYVVTKFQDQLDEEDIIKGANFIQRRQALERWETEEGKALLGLASDGDKFDFEKNGNGNGNGNSNINSNSIGQRYQIPPSILGELEKLIPMLLLGEWVVRDATVVKYQEGQSQVPHLDPCDATILVCLEETKVGGETCFPLLGHRLKNECGNGLLFFSSSTSSGAVEGQGDQSITSLHHGGRVVEGEKIVVQLMLDMEEKKELSNPFTSWLEVLNLF